MDTTKAIDLLVQVANLAQSRGILSLKDAEIVAAAIRVVKPEVKVEKKEEVSEEKKDA